MTRFGYLVVFCVLAVAGLIAYVLIARPFDRPPVAPALANPASVHCVHDLGGTLDIVDTAQGQVGMCHLPDGRVCEEWELFRTGACTDAFGSAAATSTPAAASSTPASSYQDATYFIDGGAVTLAGGQLSTSSAPGSASMTVTKYFGNDATGDLNGDGVPDAGFIITRSSGGSGTFYYAVAALQTPQGYVGTNAVLLGDRIAPQSTQIRNGDLIVNYADRAPGEPMSAQPSVGKSMYLKIEAGQLVQVAQ